MATLVLFSLSLVPLSTSNQKNFHWKTPANDAMFFFFSFFFLFGDPATPPSP